MSGCCEMPGSQSRDVTVCPASGTKGKPVTLQTVKVLLTETALRRINYSAHRFCPEPSCDVVYFDAEGSSYLTSDVRVPVWQKEPFGDRMVCYCFGESERSIRAEIQTAGRSQAIDRVRAHIAARRCACEVRNPRGACCLGDVTAAVKRVERALNGSIDAERPMVEQLGRDRG